MSVRRVYAEKKAPYAVKAEELREELHSYLGIEEAETVRILIRYDVENISEDTWQRGKGTIFSEPPVDELYEGSFPCGETDFVFSVEYLPGQFDQRADSAVQCVQLLCETEKPVIRSATTYVISGKLSPEQKQRIIGHCVNPVDSRLASEEIPETLETLFEEPADVAVFEGFTSLSPEGLKALYDSLNLAMTLRDFEHIRNYFAEEEHRDPTVTEIRVLDTYWSDHCRHTTFQTELKEITFEDGYYRPVFEASYADYLATHKEMFAGRKDKFVCLMDLALMAMRRLKKEGKLADQEESEEINACSIVVPIEVDGKTEEWLVNFKNETHNHPTEIEPFGGAATCLGGAIRDPLSGRTYVYQAMRITGAGDPTVPVSETLKGKLPQKKLVRTAAAGYSSYGNQIGLATGYVKEIYHPDYVAKRMEIGAVLGAAPRRAVMRKSSEPGDVIILLGGRTGRDGIGGATGSSKVHTQSSIEQCGAEVQKGNAPTERKLQRLFRREEVSRLIRKCNDFGAGGVSVAIGELAAGLIVDLDRVPKKYAGLDGTEIAISESQERMAVVVDPKDAEQFLAYAAEENLEATIVAEVTEEPRLRLRWRGKDIVNISRAFLDTNGAHQETNVVVSVPDEKKSYFASRDTKTDRKERFLETLSDLNVCSQKGLVEMFDSSIGAGTVLMPYGGKYQLTEIQTMIARIPVAKGKSDAVTMMSYGFDPYLSSWSPYHGAVYAVLESISKIVAAGGDYTKIRMTFQEYFRRMTEDPHTWGLPFAALLGAYSAQIAFGLPSIGGKDSMSGSFDSIHVPPTLVSFAVDVASNRVIVTPELKKAGNKLVLFTAKRDRYDLPDFEQIKQLYAAFNQAVLAGQIESAYALCGHGLAEAACKMAFGNHLGVSLQDTLPDAVLFGPGYGCILAEVRPEVLESLKCQGSVVGEVTENPAVVCGSVSIPLDQALETWKKPLEKVFPSVSGRKTPVKESPLYRGGSIYVCRNKVAKPTVFIPVFPGTNCEYDSAKAFERAGASVSVKVLQNRTEQDIRDSVEVFEREIRNAQIIMFPGGFSAGDEPDGSAKFFATAFRNEKLKEAVMDLLGKRDGLVLGICNGFQTLIKLGLVPYGEIIPEQMKDSPTLTTNTVGRHISKMAYIKVMTDRSPWLSKAPCGSVYCNPASHGEGRFVASDAWIERLFANGQVATVYVDADGNTADSEEWNINGSYAAIEGILSPDGRVLGKMAHAERRGDGVALNCYGEQNMNLFEAGTAYFG